jgi:hypothetical protein
MEKNNRMKELIKRIYETPESELKAEILRIDADELKRAAQGLGLDLSASGKPISESKRFDVALAIKATQGAGQVEEEAKKPTIEAPSISAAKKVSEEPTAKKETEQRSKSSIQEVQKRLQTLRKELSACEKELAELIEENAKKNRALTQHELILARRARFEKQVKK